MLTSIRQTDRQDTRAEQHRTNRISRSQPDIRARHMNRTNNIGSTERPEASSRTDTSRRTDTRTEQTVLDQQDNQEPDRQIGAQEVMPSIPCCLFCSCVLSVCLLVVLSILRCLFHSPAVRLTVRLLVTLLILRCLFCS